MITNTLVSPFVKLIQTLLETDIVFVCSNRRGESVTLYTHNGKAVLTFLERLGFEKVNEHTYSKLGVNVIPVGNLLVYEKADELVATCFSPNVWAGMKQEVRDKAWGVALHDHFKSLFVQEREHVPEDSGIKN